MTLLAETKFRPKAPAFKEIKSTYSVGSVSNSDSTYNLYVLFIDPSNLFLIIILD